MTSALNRFTRSRLRHSLRTAAALALLCLAAMPHPGAWAGNDLPKAAIDTVTSTIAAEKRSTERGEKWEREQAALMEEVRQARLEYAWYARQAKTFEQYVATAEARVAELSKTRRELDRMEAELEGELVRVVDAMDDFVAGDLPFLTRERGDRLAFLHKTVADYDLASAEKLRRVFEGLQAEMGYGGGVERTPGVIATAQGEYNVTLLRAGRMALYALAPDGLRAWRWAREDGFVPMENQAVEPLVAVDGMLAENRVSALADLPVEEGE